MLPGQRSFDLLKTKRNCLGESQSFLHGNFLNPFVGLWANLNICSVNLDMSHLADPFLFGFISVVLTLLAIPLNLRSDILIVLCRQNHVTD